VEDRERVEQRIGAGETPERGERSALERRFSCVSIAPLDRPVVPEV